MENGERSKELTRREALRRGAAVGGLVWMAPAVKSITMAAGNAAATSGTTTTGSTSTTSTSTTSTSTTTTTPTTTTTSTTTTTTTPTTTTTTPGPDISYIGMQVTCGQGPNVFGYTIKYEGCQGDDCFESEPGNFPKCDGFVVSGQKADGDDLGFLTEGPDANGCVTVHVPAGCTVTASVVKGGQCCDPGPTGSGTLVFCKPAPC